VHIFVCVFVQLCSKEEPKRSTGKSSASANVMKAWLNTSASKRSADMSSSEELFSADKKPKTE